MAKSKQKQYIVIGLDRFGRSVAKNLEQNDCMVLAIDKDQKKVNQISDYVTSAMCLDITDEEVADELGLNNFDAAIISFANSLETAVLATVCIKERGIPFVIAEAYDEIQGKVLEKVGVDKIVYSEQEMGAHLANNLAFDHIIDSVEVSADYTIAEIQTPVSWEGKSLIELNLRKKYEINVIALKRNNEINVTPVADMPLLKDDVLVILGKNDILKKLSRSL
ncbi:MAG: potassium channel family protein [Lachnospira sp.]